jgi:excisionase family DNA binding protein
MNARKQYLRPGAIAELTGMSIRTIRRWIRDDVLPSTKLGGARLVATKDLQAVLSAPQYKAKKPLTSKTKYGDEQEVTACRENISQEQVPCIV